MTEIDIYIWTRMDGIHNTFNFIAILSGLLFMVSVFILMLSDDDNEGKIKSITKNVSIVFLTSAFLCVVFPTSKDYAMIKIIPKIANSKAIQVDAPELYDMAVKALKSKLSGETTEETK